MPNFKTALKYVDTGLRREDRNEYRLTESFAYELLDRGSGVVMIVPAGYVTDFASIPPIFRRWFQPNGPWAKAAVLHDWLYSIGAPQDCCSLALRIWRTIVHKLFADYVFFEAMGVLKIPLVQRLMLTSAVVVGGWCGFGRVEPSNAGIIASVRKGVSHVE